MINKIVKNIQASPKKYKYTFIGILLAIIFFLPLILADQRYILFLMCVSGIYIIVNSGLDLCFGYSGQISIGQAAFYAIGAYTSAILSTNYGVPVFLAMLCGGITAAIIGYLLSFSAVKLVHHFLALVTIGFGEIVRLLILNSVDVTGGPDGFIGIPALKLFGITFGTNQSFFYIVFVLTIVFLVLKSSIVNSRVGRAFIAIRENPIASEAFGIKLSRYKAMAFGVGALFAGIGGALYAHLVRFISPETFSLDQSIMFLVMVLIGGMGTFLGPIVGAVLVIIVNEWLQVFGDFQMAIYGVIIIVVLFFLPKGIIGTLKDKSFFLKSKMTRKEGE